MHALKYVGMYYVHVLYLHYNYVEYITSPHGRRIIDESREVIVIARQASGTDDCVSTKNTTQWK